MAENTTGHIYTVSKLTREIKSLLEETYPFIWVTGEISNYTIPASGHSYFTLKDRQTIISAVMFKNQKRRLTFEPEPGMKIIGLARLSLYEPRGSYQLIFEHLEPEGTGAIQVAFEQLKKKLLAQGLFDDKYKKSIPFLPSRINIITSGTGAAVRDIINVAQRRFPNCVLEIVPVKVQGHGSEDEITDALTLVNQDQRSDLIILARGGGSLEDLAAFNSEAVARAIFNSDIPIITGIGHEIDFTIADFVSDLRAPTPSAAAELALPDKNDLTLRVLQLQENLTILFRKKVAALHQTVLHFTSQLKNPKTIIFDFRFRLEDYESRLNNMIKQYVHYNKEKLCWLSESLHSKNPLKKILDYRQSVQALTESLTLHFDKKFQHMKINHSSLNFKLEALNPIAVLKRGYSISRFVSDQKVIMDSKDVKQNDQIEVVLSRGRLITRVVKANG